MKKVIVLLAFTIAFGLSTSSVRAVFCLNAPQIMTASHRLDRETHQFERQLFGLRGYRHLTDDVRSLARSVRHLHRLAEKNTSCEHLRADFRVVEERFQHVRHRLRQAHRIHHDRYIMDDWRELVREFRNVRNEVYASRIGGIDRFLDLIQ